MFLLSPCFKLGLINQLISLFDAFSQTLPINVGIQNLVRAQEPDNYRIKLNAFSLPHEAKTFGVILSLNELYIFTKNNLNIYTN